jgi:hypothetical protein
MAFKDQEVSATMIHEYPWRDCILMEELRFEPCSRVTDGEKSCKRSIKHFDSRPPTRSCSNGESTSKLSKPNHIFLLKFSA